MSQLLKYKYYDTPEGQDIFKKVIATSKYSAGAGLAAGFFDVLMYSHPKGFVNTTGRFLWYVGPLVGMTTAYALTTNAAQNIRGKNDKINYFLGGAAAGAIFSAWQRAPVAALPAMVFLGFAGMIKKTAVDAGYEFFPEVPQATKTIQSLRHDWTLTEDVEQLKNFTTASQ